MAVTIWVGPVACLWVNESALVFQARRSRVPPPLPGSGLLELRTNDGVRLDGLLLPYTGEAEYGFCSARRATGPSTGTCGVTWSHCARPGSTFLRSSTAVDSPRLPVLGA